MEEKRKIDGKTVLKIIILAGVICFGSIFMVMSFANEESYTGEFITANKVYMPNNNINLVVYFNETPDTHFLIFENWDAKHSVILSNLDEGDRVKIWYKEFVFGVRTIVEIEIL